MSSEEAHDEKASQEVKEGVELYKRIIAGFGRAVTTLIIVIAASTSKAGK